MASIRERIETIFAAMAFGEANAEAEARELLGQTRGQATQASRTVRKDSRPRVRV